MICIVYGPDQFEQTDSNITILRNIYGSKERIIVFAYESEIRDSVR